MHGEYQARRKHRMTRSNQHPVGLGANQGTPRSHSRLSTTRTNYPFSSFFSSFFFFFFSLFSSFLLFFFRVWLITEPRAEARRLLNEFMAYRREEKPPKQTSRDSQKSPGYFHAIRPYSLIVGAGWGGNTCW